MSHEVKLRPVLYLGSLRLFRELILSLTQGSKSGHKNNESRLLIRGAPDIRPFLYPVSSRISGWLDIRRISG